MRNKYFLISMLLFVLAFVGAAYESIIPLPWGGTAHRADDPRRDLVEQEASSVVAEVGALIELPQGETPTVATVSDPAKLGAQAFFARAQVGDKVLLYTKARKAYLYRPSERKLIEVAPITTSIQ